MFTLHDQGERTQLGVVAHHGAVQNGTARPHIDAAADGDVVNLHDAVFKQMGLRARHAIDFTVVANGDAVVLGQVGSIQIHTVTDFGTKQFLLKNIYWKENGELAWRFNLDVIIKKIENIGEATPNENSCNTPTLFIRGEKSNYILDEDLDMIHEVFPRSMLETISDAGHWVHAEKPKAFYDCVINFIK